MPDIPTAEVIRRFNEAFLGHDPAALADLVADDCVMESVQPAPAGTRYEGRDACLTFWQDLAADRSTSFAPEDVVVAGERAVILWRARFGGDETSPVFDDRAGGSVRGVNIMHVRDGRIVEALGYAKTP